MKSASLKLNRKSDSALSLVGFIDTGCFFVPLISTKLFHPHCHSELFISFSCFHSPSLGDSKVTV